MKRYNAQFLLVFLMSFICYGCAKYGEYSSKCGNEPETALEGLYKEYSDGNFEQAQHYLTKADSTYYSDLKNELGEQYFDEKMKLNSFLAQKTTWTVEKKSINKDDTAQITLSFTQPDMAMIGKIMGESCAETIINNIDCEGDECISQSSKTKSVFKRIKDEVSSEFMTSEAEFDFVCENDLWKVELNLALHDLIDDDLLEVVRLYSQEHKKDVAVKILNEIPIKYKNAKYDEDLIDYVWGIINGIHEEIFEARSLYYNEGDKDEAVNKLEEIRLKYKNARYHEDLLDMILDKIKKEAAEKRIKKDQWNKG